MAASPAPGPDEVLARALLRSDPDEAARVVESSRDAETAALLEAEPSDVVSALLRRLTPDRGARVLAALAPETARTQMARLNPGRAAAMVARLDPEEQEALLGSLAPELADELRELAAFPAETAGALMDPRVTTFRPDATVREVLRRLRRFRSRRIQDLFLVDPEGRLSGAVSLQEAVLASPETSLGSLSPGLPPSVLSVAPREEIVEVFEEHGVSSLPVVDVEGRLLGVLRQREIVTAAREQATASAVTMVGASEQERALSTPIFAMRKRLPWLQVNLLTAFLAASVVGLFEETIARVTALAVLLPVVAGQSGNTGAQALAVTMRGLALREVRVRHWLRVAGKELMAGFGNGVAVAAVTAGAVYLWSRSPGLAAVIGLSMVISMTLAGFSGAGIPML
ncbi:MAG: CBS domain-containing protein, partial [Myxococcota bacterium]|nr:CBS domain-containing protein [Myxococcota bacterium]